jgi:hypothetical protein
VVSTPLLTVPVYQTVPPLGAATTSAPSIFRQSVLGAASHSIVDPSALWVVIPFTATDVPSGQVRARCTLIGCFAGSVWTHSTALTVIALGASLPVLTVAVVVVVAAVAADLESLVHDVTTSNAAVRTVVANLIGGWTPSVPAWFPLLRIR